MSGTIALVVGAGEGQRFGGQLPKQYRELAGIAVLRRSLEVFIEHPGITAVRAIIHSDHLDFYKEMLLLS